MSNTQEVIPTGYKKRADGTLVPETMIKPIDLARDQVVYDLVEKAKAVSKHVGTFKADAFSEIAAFVDMSVEQYGVKLGGTKGNVTLTSFDGRYKILRAWQDRITFDERLQAAKLLIDNCLKRFTLEGRDEARVLLNDTFKVDKEGMVSTSKVLGLRRHNITDPEWLRAMEAISDSLQIAGGKAYVRVYERVGDTDEYKPISLNVSGA